MAFALRVAWRYLASNPLQTLLLIAGVALSVVVFVFITALIQGLAIFLTDQVTGNVAHVTLEPPVRTARVLGADARFAAQPVSTVQRLQIRNWLEVETLATTLPGVTQVSPRLVGSGFLVRGEAVQPVSVQGIDPVDLDAISPISPKIIAGSADLASGGLLIGADLATNLGLAAGMPVLLRSDRGSERLITIAGVFRTGLGSLDERVAFLALSSARPLFDLPNGVSQIELKLADPQRAPQVARLLGDATGLKATPWQEKNRSLEQALEGQGRTGSFIQVFALFSIVITVSSALLLSSYRRRGEIGIMRSFGISKAFIGTVFMAQGLLIGTVGALSGAALGYGLCLELATLTDRRGDALLPIAPEEGGYLVVIVATIIGSVLAAILPARAATRVDPVEVIQQ